MIKPKNKILFSTKTLTYDKFDTFYIKTFKIMNVKNTIMELCLPNIKIFSKFHVSFIIKIPLNTFLTTI